MRRVEILMEVLEIKSSSAISKITFNDDDNLVGVSFTYNPKKEYLYFCEDLSSIKKQVKDIESKGLSIGKLINSLIKDTTLKVIEI